MTVVVKNYYIDKAPTNKGKCFNCRNDILKGTPRIYYIDKMKRIINKIEGMQVKRLICHRCLPDYIDTEKWMLIRLLKDIRKIKSKYNRMLKGKKIKSLIQKEIMLRSLLKQPQ